MEQHLIDSARILAPGAAGLAPTDPGWGGQDFVAGAGWAGQVRVGETTTGVPVVVPLLGTAGWCVVPEEEDSPAPDAPGAAEHDSGEGHRAGTSYGPTAPSSRRAGAEEPHRDSDPGAYRRAALRVVQQAVLRTVAASSAFGVRVDCLDPAVSGILGVLGGVTAQFPQVVGRAVHDDVEVRRVLTRLVETSAARGHRMAQAGAATFQELQARSRGADAHHLLVVLDYPRGIDQAAQTNLVRLAATGAQRGISLLVTYDWTAEPAPGVDPDALLDHLTGIVAGTDDLFVSDVFDTPVIPDDPISDLPAVVRQVLARTSDAKLPTLAFDDTLPPPDQWWTPVVDGLETVVGFTDQDPVAVRLRTSNPPLPHLLVAGAIGQGKSNFLLTLIHGLAVRYSPADLELYLLDFKHGVEFARLGPAAGREYFLPHVKVLGIHADRMFGVAVLRHLNEELARRAAMFKAADVVDLADFPQEGFGGVPRPARIVAVLDEFQVLLDGDDDLAEEAINLLERLARLGRAYGIHLEFSTQTLDGTPKLTMKRDAIFGQVPTRIALKTTVSDSQVVLGNGNTAAAGLRFPGQAIVNTNYGHLEDNQLVQIAYADHQRLSALRRQLWERAGGSSMRPPRVFHLADPAHLPTALTTSLRGTSVSAPSGGTPSVSLPGPAVAWAGLPVAVTEEPTAIPVTHEPGAGVMVVGDGPTDALGVLTGLTLSAILTGAGAADASSGARPRVVILDATATDKSTAAGKRALVDVAFAAGCDVEHLTTPAAITARLFALAEQVHARIVPGRMILVGIGMHALPGMKESAEDRIETPADALDEVLRDGPAAGVVTFAWWNRLHVITDQLGYRRANIAAYVFLRHPADGVRQATGLPLLKWDSQPARALVWDGIGVEPTHVVPFAPLTDQDATALIRRLQHVPEVTENGGEES
ncbi:FtsK/SpoIIIE domain-containing protein [Promicromonospora sp. NPDC057138]|uniref:FtsK/SpoIIIE domain-containing protein n=1 Tax=Promicromonospora sp. NPDC057138 TaxID=3346031 RepID=UPI0036431451